VNNEGRRVTILPKQFRRLAELDAQSSGAIEVIQAGSTLYLNNGSTKLHINSNGDDIPPPNQEPLC
jgi:hypothetical protein